MKMTTEMRLIENERKRTTFSVEELTNVFDGGKEETKNRRELEQFVKNDPQLKKMELCHMGREERFSEAMRRTIHFYRTFFNSSRSPSVLKQIPRALGKDVTLIIHTGVFIPSIMSFGSDEQVAKWIPLSVNLHIIGTYAQTELGHGTYLRGLETIATYDAQREEFVINCPQITAMKWWPGDLGKSANHALVMADLRIGGKRYGMHAFIVQIRDLTTHQPLPGVIVGDIGNKMAFETTDNGFLYLQNVRIPRENMLCKHAQISPDGTYTKKSSDRLMYGGMVNVRVNLLMMEAVLPLAQACTIAIRYSSVRKQGTLDPKKPEVAVLDYVAQQHKLFPQLAMVYTTCFASNALLVKHKAFVERSNMEDISELPEIHALSAGMKASVTEQCLAASEICRRACGGHGYSDASGLPMIINRMMASCTYEGENTVMYLQCARYLVKCMDNPSTTSLCATVAYLNERDFVCSAYSARDFKQVDILVKCLQQRSKAIVKEAVAQLRQFTKSGQEMHNAWNSAAVYLLNAAKVHILQYIASTSARKLDTLSCSSPVRNVLSQLVALYVLNIINNSSGDFLKTGVLNQMQCKNAQAAELELLTELRPNAVGLVDAFDLSDDSLQSCLGAYDGNVYERLFECAKRAPLNKTEVHEDSYKYIRSSLHKGRDILEGKSQSKL